MLLVSLYFNATSMSDNNEVHVTNCSIPPDNMLYGITEETLPTGNVQPVAAREYEEVSHSHSQSNSSCVFEGAIFSDSGRMEGYAYAEVGPFNEKVSD